MNVIEIGKPYSGPVPQQDGIIFEIGPDGDMQMLIQFQKPNREEKLALAYGFLHYSIYRHVGNIVLACWVFKFHAPISYVDAPFYAGLYTGGRVSKFLDTEQNLLQVIILDGPIVQGIRAVGLHREAMARFKSIVREQLSPIDKYLYSVEVDNLFKLHPKEIFQRGQIFKHREENP